MRHRVTTVRTKSGFTVQAYDGSSLVAAREYPTFALSKADTTRALAPNKEWPDGWSATTKVGVSGWDEIASRVAAAKGNRKGTKYAGDLAELISDGSLQAEVRRACEAAWANPVGGSPFCVVQGERRAALGDVSVLELNEWAKREQLATAVSGIAGQPLGWIPMLVESAAVQVLAAEVSAGGTPNTLRNSPEQLTRAVVGMLMTIGRETSFGANLGPRDVNSPCGAGQVAVKGFSNEVIRRGAEYAGLPSYYVWPWALRDMEAENQLQRRNVLSADAVKQFEQRRDYARYLVTLYPAPLGEKTDDPVGRNQTDLVAQVHRSHLRALWNCSAKSRLAALVADIGVPECWRPWAMLDYVYHNGSPYAPNLRNSLDWTVWYYTGSNATGWKLHSYDLLDALVSGLAAYTRLPAL